MKSSPILRIRSHTSRPFSSPEKNPFLIYDMNNPTEKTINETLITLQKPNSNYYNSSNYSYDHNEIKTYEAYLRNNNKRGIRSDHNFNRFLGFMHSGLSTKKELLQARENIKTIENYRGTSYKNPKKNNLQENSIINQKNFEKKIKKQSEKLNNKSTLVKINEVLRELYEEKKRTKKIIKYTDSNKTLANSKTIHASSKISQLTRHSDSFDEKSKLLENSESFIPKAVTKALEQLKNFIIDVPLLDEDEDMKQKNINVSPEKEKTDSVRTSYFRKTSKVLPGKQYNNEKHLKEDFKMFKGIKGNKLVRKFTEMADEEAHEKEMNYYQTLLRLKNMGNPKIGGQSNVCDYNEELRKIYKREQMIRSHGKALRKKFKRLKGEVDSIEEKHLVKDKMDKLEIKIHRGLMSDYRKDKRKVIVDMVEKMGKLKHKNTL